MKTLTRRPYLKYILISAVIFVLLLGIRWAWSSQFTTDDSYHPMQGVLDLRGQHLDPDTPIYLNGEWMFYPEAFVSERDRTTGTVESPTFIQVPGDWSSKLSQNESSYGYGTYHLRILIDPLKEPVSFWFQDIQSSSVVEINGVVTGGSGTPATNATDYKPFNITYVSNYAIEGTTEIELLVRAANFDAPNNGGIMRSVRFGTETAIEQTRWYSIGSQIVLCVVILLHGLYALLFLLYNRKERVLFYVGMLMVCVAVAVLLGRDNLLLQWLPFNYTWTSKLRIIALLWQNQCILLIFRHFAGTPARSVGLRAYTGLLVAISVILLVMPASFANNFVDYGLFIGVYVISFLWFIYTAGTMVFKKQPDKDVVFLLLTAVGITSNLIWTIFETSFDISTVYYPIDIIVSQIGFSTYWFKKYFRNAKDNAALNEQLLRADRLKDQFLANTSHELRTPLHGIMNIAQTVVEKEHEKISSGSKKDMELLITISRRMSHLLNDLLDVAKLQEKHVVLQRQPMYMQAVVPGVVSMLRFMTEGRPIELHVAIDDQVPPVFADEKRVVQVLYNLLHNAIKYTNEGNITITMDTIDNYARIHISDTGMGMDTATQERIFTRYEQGTTGSSNEGGLGLGLNISRQLVQLHGGELTVQSTLGQGSTFTFGLPLASSHDHSLEAAMPTLDDDQLGMEKSPDIHSAAYRETAATFTMPSLLLQSEIHLLVVDDDTVNLSVLVGILSSEPYHITTARSAYEAIELLSARRWDLLISDVMMPGLSGYDLTRKVRERYSVTELPILLLTARSQQADIYEGFSSGANDYVTKPVDAIELKFRIRALIALKHAMNERMRIESAYLQAQIQPHFLFNTLNAIMALSEFDVQEMQKLGYAFTSYLRLSFDFLNTGESVKLAREIELIEAYLYIEQQRFEDRMKVKWEVDSDLHIRIAPLTIQPIVENAVKHGLMSKSQGGTIHIKIKRMEDIVLIEVRDDGKGMEQEIADQLLSPGQSGKRGVGLANTHRRLRQLYQSELSITSEPGIGTVVSFSIPVVTDTP